MLNLTSLTGKGVILAILDSGIDYTLPDFLTEKGETKILQIYDQETNKTYTQTEINTAITEIKSGKPIWQTRVPITDTTGHGTAVASIAAGTINGIAKDAELLIIKLSKSKNTTFPLSTQLMRAITYSLTYATTKNKPIVINISYGNTYGDHKGNSLIERYIDNASEIGKTAIVIGTGNEAASNGHTSGVALTKKIIELSVSNYETNFNLQLWKYYQDTFNVTITSPSGESYAIDHTQIQKSGTLRISLETTDLLIFLGKPQPYTIEQELFIDFIPQNNYITEGIWQITLTPITVVTGEYHLYLSSYTTRNTATQFLTPTPDMTITIPATSRKAISVGAYDSFHKSYADFSGRGYVYRYDSATKSLIAEVKPDIVAPGVDIAVPLPGGGYEKVSGTSFATPYVSGMCALFMEWGIVQKNDPFLYGERLKATLIANATPIGVNETIPNSKIGWGKV
jgi:subtilisin family serine protease